MNHDSAPSKPESSGNAMRCRAFSIVMCLVAVLSISIFTIEPQASAQDGTSAATPTPPTNCILPDVTVAEGSTGEEPPLLPGLDDASPEASPQASPVASTPRASLEIDITATTRVLANCLSEYKLDTVVTLTGDAFRGQLLGATEDVDADTYKALAGTLTSLPFTIVSIQGIEGTGRGTAEATISYTVAHQLRTGVWEFQLIDNGFDRKWIVSSESRQEPDVPDGTVSIAVDISGDKFRPTPTEAKGTTVKLDGTNDDQGDHEMLVVKLASGITSDQLLTNPGPELPEGVEFIGQLTIPARSTGSLILTNLEPGTYTIVCLLPDDAGVPHLASGMQTTFKVS